MYYCCEIFCGLSKNLCCHNASCGIFIQELAGHVKKSQNSFFRCSHCVGKLWQSRFFITIMKNKKAEIVLKCQCRFNRPFFWKLWNVLILFYTAADNIVLMKTSSLSRISVVRICASRYICIGAKKVPMPLIWSHTQGRKLSFAGLKMDPFDRLMSCSSGW